MAEIAQDGLSDFILSSMKNQNVRGCIECQYFEVAILRADICITQNVYIFKMLLTCPELTNLHYIYTEDVTDLPQTDQVTLYIYSRCY